MCGPKKLFTDGGGHCYIEEMAIYKKEKKFI